MSTLGVTPPLLSLCRCPFFPFLSLQSRRLSKHSTVSRKRQLPLNPPKNHLRSASVAAVVVSAAVEASAAEAEDSAVAAGEDADSEAEVTTRSNRRERRKRADGAEIVPAVESPRIITPVSFLCCLFAHRSFGVRPVVLCVRACVRASVCSVSASGWGGRGFGRRGWGGRGWGRRGWGGRGWGRGGWGRGRGQNAETQ